MKFRNLLIILFLTICAKAYGQQQDVDFHLNAHLFPGTKVLKVKRDFYDPYLWVLAANNEVYRVNSLTLAIDDYTAAFAAYNNLQFIDIAGRSKDTVFIATNSTNIIHFKNGAIRLVGTADGIPGTVNSVGMDAGLLYQLQRPTPLLMIGTDKGFREYDSNTETITNQSDDGNSKVYEATYRTEMYKDSSAITADFITGDTIQYQPAPFIPGNGSVVTPYLWEGGNEFGYNINTAVNVNESLYIYDPVYTNLFWGNSRGMFQNLSNWSYWSIYVPSGHYLNDINVNKITTIYGLTAFGNGGAYEQNPKIKQNLLIGTDSGFYFSSSLYTGQPSFLRNFSLFHFAGLGNTVINDICVNTASITQPICEDGVWLAAADGLYLLKPDYAEFINNAQKLQVVNFKNQPISVSSLNVCLGDSVFSMIDTVQYTGKSIQWYKNGNQLPFEIKDSLAIKTSGDYYAVLYDPCENVHLETNHLQVTIISAPVFTFSYPDKTQYCNNIPDTLKVDQNPGYHYRWYTNGLLNGDTTSTYVVTQSGKYKVELSACTNSWVTSREVEVDLISLPIPKITPDQAIYCAGDSANLSINIPTDPTYTINWYRNGNLLAKDQDSIAINDTTAGNYTVVINSNISACTQSSTPFQLAFTPAPIFTFNYPNILNYCAGNPAVLKVQGNAAYQYRWYTNDVLNGITTDSISITQSGKYKVEVSACLNSWVSSKEVTVNIIQLAVPALKSDKQAYCIGDQATLSLNIPVDPTYTINWFRDGNMVASYQDLTSVSTAIPGLYNVEVASKIVGNCIQTSAPLPLTFNPFPTVDIRQIIKTTLCTGQTVDLKVTYNGGTVKWSTGESTDQISVSTSGNYTATITSPAGCMTDTSINVQFLPNPIVAVKDTGLCEYTKETVILTAPTGFSKYEWNNQVAGNTYKVSSPQIVTLTVTDINGCQATQQIVIADKCPNIYIPNAFTPNGDGINDAWDISGLGNDPTTLIRVYTRYGTEVYQNRGLYTPWNGQYQGKRLPEGAYYYIINAKKGTQSFSGSLTIIY